MNRATLKPGAKLTDVDRRILALADGTRTSQEIAMGMNWASTGSVGNYVKRLANHGARIKRNPVKVTHMNVEPVKSDLRQPSQEQERLIFEMLGVVYDTKAKRFTGCESDVTVAAALGNGIMFGWVAAIRERFFGPVGTNEELEKLQADMREWQDKAQALRKVAEDAVAGITAAQSAVLDMQRRIDALIKAAGPRARV